jgi:hypothetical protein
MKRIAILMFALLASGLVRGDAMVYASKTRSSSTQRPLP